MTMSAATLPQGNAARTLSLWAKDAAPSGHDWKFAANWGGTADSQSFLAAG